MLAFKNVNLVCFQFFQILTDRLTWRCLNFLTYTDSSNKDQNLALGFALRANFRFGPNGRLWYLWHGGGSGFQPFAIAVGTHEVCSGKFLMRDRLSGIFKCFLIRSTHGGWVWCIILISWYVPLVWIYKKDMKQKGQTNSAWRTFK